RWGSLVSSGAANRPGTSPARSRRGHPQLSERLRKRRFPAKNGGSPVELPQTGVREVSYAYRGECGSERGRAGRVHWRRDAGTADRAGELGDGGGTVLEQVPDAFRARGQEIERVFGLDVLRQHDDAGAGVLLANLARGTQALVGVRRRHPDVDDRDIRAVRPDL